MKKMKVSVVRGLGRLLFGSCIWESPFTSAELIDEIYSGIKSARLITVLVLVIMLGCCIRVSLDKSVGKEQQHS